MAKTTVQKAVEWALATAKDDSHGYNNEKGKRTGPDYACSSFIAAAWRAAGLDVPADAYTATMRKQFLAVGFEDVSDKVDLKTGKGMIAGDIVLLPGKHVEMVVNTKHQLVGARGDAFGGAENGKKGDQTGEEISVRGWFDYGWRFCLRYKDQNTKKPTTETPKEAKKVKYIVQAGAFESKANAENRCYQVRKFVSDAFIFTEDGMYKVQAGAFEKKANAEALCERLNKNGLPAFVR